EIAYFLCALPLLAMIIPSTARYLMAYQPILWIFFYVGAATLLRPLTSRVARPALLPLAGLLLTFAGVGGLVMLRSARIAGTEANRSGSISIGQTRAYVGEVSSTFRALRDFLDTLDRKQSLLVGTRGNFGRWKAISGFSYYWPDSVFEKAVANRDVYLLLECGTFETCHDFSRWERHGRDTLRVFGEFQFDSVFASTTTHAKARVYRIRLKP
ncbi:MAG: hypothetical protein ABIR58_07970, partial [Gemmatimonadaceae bacterium]